MATARKTKSGKTGVTRTKNVEKKELFKCPFCMRDLEKRHFYTSSDPNIKTGITRICKECSNQMVLDKNGKVSRDRVQMVLEYSKWIHHTPEQDIRSGVQ